MSATTKNTILVPTDFSEVADAALDHALQIAKKFDNNIALVHIADEGGIGFLTSDVKENLYREAIQMKLDKIASFCKEQGIQVSTHIETGRVYKRIAEKAAELGCDSIVMGTHGASGIGQIIGSNASRVITHANVPVVIVREKMTRNGYANILLPIDFTRETKQKAYWAQHLSKVFNSTIHVVGFKENDEFLQNRIMASMAQVERYFQNKGVNYSARIIDGHGNYADQTLSLAFEVQADLILIMTQSESSIGEYIIGSYAQQIVNKSVKVPVMCVNPTSEGFINEEMW